MEPNLGWTALSREALRRAEAKIREDIQGVRDEIGFLVLHQGYADRFFPGTSVLQTRLRYILFVPWTYERIANRSGNRQRFDALLQDEEIRLAGRLKKANEEGIIGGKSFPKPTSQPASMVYWTALGKWGLLRTSYDGDLPARMTIHSLLARRKEINRLLDDDKNPLDEERKIFVSLPPPPKEWDDLSTPLNFHISLDEKQFLRKFLIGVPKPGIVPIPSLLSRLTESNLIVTGVEVPWEKSVIDVADPEDRKALIRARQAAAISAIGRGVYAALVEKLRDEKDHVSTSNVHRGNLNTVITKYRKQALAIELKTVVQDIPSISGIFREVLEETQKWLRTASLPISKLYPLYEQAEVYRKGNRARLAGTLAGKRRRAEWIPEEHTKAAPLHYRWSNVRRLLADIGDD